ncbi:MAG: hypothetical protein ABEJ76_05785 [Halanaeroarchaeum sp.]
MTDDTDPRKGRYRPGQLLRRQFLKAAGAGLAATAFGSGVAAADSDGKPYVGPLSASYDAATVVPGEIDRVTTEVGGDGEGEGEEEHREIPKKGPEATGSATGGGGDVQRSVATGDLVERDFDGLGAADVRGVVPSDAQVGAGPDHVFEAINSRLAAYTKDGEQLFEYTLDDWFQNVSPYIYEGGPEGEEGPADFFQDYIIFDPRVRYDEGADRFILACVDLSLNTLFGGFLLSVSSTDDPTDPWYNYYVPPLYPDGEGGTEERPGLVDYPELGYDEDAIYLTQNFFPGPFTQATMVALDKDAAAAGETADANHFTGLKNPDGSPAFTVQPAAVDGSSPGHFANSTYFQGQTLTVWGIEDPLTDDPSFWNEAVPVRPYHNPPSGAEQPETEEKIDMGDDRLMRVSFDGEHLWTAHTVNDGRARWYELDPSEGSVVQSGSFKRHGRASFFPAIEADGTGAAFVYNTASPASDGSGYVGMEVAARTPADPAGDVGAFQVVQEGVDDYDYVDGPAGEPDTGPQVMRWGDYNGISPDPADGGFWIVSQYASTPSPRAEEKDYLDDSDYDTRIAYVTLE